MLPEYAVSKPCRNTTLIVLSIVLMIAVSAVFLQVGNFQFINYDDDIYVTSNQQVAKGLTGKNIIWAFTSVEENNWHPLTWLSHMSDVQLFGLTPGGHHLTSVFLHLLSTLLLLLYLFRLTNALWQSLFVATLFALHPLHVQSVAWVAERKDVLSAFFWFLTLFLYAEYKVNSNRRFYYLALLSFTCGLMSKPIVVTLPLILLLLDYYPLAPRQDRRFPETSIRFFETIAFLREKLPFFIGSLLSAAITIYAQHSGGALVEFSEKTFWFRIENALVAYISYIYKTIWPSKLSIFYPYPLTIPFWQTLGSLIILLLISWGAIRIRRQFSVLVVGWFWFLITLVPVIGIVQVGGQSMADRYTYIPLVGLFMMAAWGVPEGIKQFAFRKGLLALLAGVAIGSSTVMTWQQLGYWHDAISLYRHSLRSTTGNFVINYNLGVALAQRGDNEAALHYFREALQINPASATAHNNAGSLLIKKGDLDGAITEFSESLRLNPQHENARTNLQRARDQKQALELAMKSGVKKAAPPLFLTTGNP